MASNGNGVLSAEGKATQGHRRRLYPGVSVVSEDDAADCYVVEGHKAASSRALDFLAAFRRTKGDWELWSPDRKSRVSLARVRRPHSVEFTETTVAHRQSGKPVAGGARRKADVGVVGELALRPLTRAQDPGPVVAGSAADTHKTGLSMSLTLSDRRRPPTCVRGTRTRQSRGALDCAHEFEQHRVSARITRASTESTGHGGAQAEDSFLDSRNQSFPGESATKVMARRESSLRHPETYSRWVCSLRGIMRQLEAGRDIKSGDPPPKRSKIQSGVHFHEQIGMLSEEVLASVQLQLDLVRSEMAGLYQASLGYLDVEASRGINDFVWKYGQRRLELGMLRSHLFEEPWSLCDAPGMRGNTEGNGLKVWMSGLMVKRFALHHNQHVQHAILPFFNALKNSQGQVNKRQYMALNVKLFRTLYPAFDTAYAQLVAEEDWNVDSGSIVGAQRLFIDQQQFFQSMLELADNWVEEPAVEQFVTWLNKLRISIFDSDGVLLPDDLIMHDERFWYDGIDPFPPDFFGKLNTLTAQGTRNSMFRAIRSQQHSQDSRYKRAAAKLLEAQSHGQASRQKSGQQWISTKSKESQDHPQRPQVREAFNVNVEGKSLSLMQVYAGGEAPVKSYLNQVRVPNVWASELKQLASDYLQAAAGQSGTVKHEDTGEGCSQIREKECLEEDSSTKTAEGRSALEAVDARQQESDFVNDESLLGFERGNSYESDLYADEEAGLLLAPEMLKGTLFAQFEDAGDVRKLRKLHDIIYARVKTPEVITEMSMRFGLMDQGTQSCSPECDEPTRREVLTRASRWPRVGKPSRREWARFKAARFKEREALHIRRRGERSAALSSYFQDKEMEEKMRHMKSFAEREEEKEARRKHFQVSQYQQRRLDPHFKKVEISRQFLKAIASTVGQNGEARHVNSAKSSSSECVRPDNGFEFSQDELEKDQTRLARMGLTPPQSAMAFQSQQEQRFSRPSTSSLTSPAVPGTPLPYIDEGCGLPDNNANKPASGWGNSTPALGTERSGDKDDPVLGWSSGVLVNVSTPSEPGQSSRRSTAPVDASAAVIVGKTGNWKRLSTPVHQNYLGSFSPAITPSLRPVSSSFSPALTPLKEVMAPDIESERKSSRAHGSRNQDSAGSSRKMSREQWKRTRKTMNSPGAVLNSFLSEDLRQERRTASRASSSEVQPSLSQLRTAHVREIHSGSKERLGAWGDGDREVHSPIIMDEYQVGPVIAEPPQMQGPVIAEPIVSIKVRKKIEAYKSDPSLSKFEDKQNEFHVNYARFRQLKSDLNQEDSSDEELLLPKLDLQIKSSMDEHKSRAGWTKGKRSAK